MELKRLNRNKALEAWHVFVEEINSQQPLIRRERQITNKKTGKKETQIYYAQPKLIDSNTEKIGSRIIVCYCDTYYLIYNSRILSAAYADGSLPSLFTNGPTLARKCTVSERTVRNHMRKLKAKGIDLITGYKFHGTHHDFEVWINPKFLWPEAPNQALSPQAEIEKKLQISAFSAPQRTSLPLITVHVTHDTIEKEISIVDKSGVALPQNALPKGEGSTGNTTRTFTSNTGPQNRQNMGKEAEPEALADPSQATLRKPGGARPKAVLSETFRKYVENFWLYAWKMLYSDIPFSAEGVSRAKNAIYYGVYHEFKRADMTAQDWENYQSELFERIDLAAAYYKNYEQKQLLDKYLPDKKPPLPFAEFKPGAGYFDWENTRGFRNTYQWWLKRETWRYQQKIDDAIKKARKELKAHHAGKAPKRQQEKSLMQVFRHHEALIKPYGRQALERFYSQNQVFHAKLNNTHGT